jgi:hypothetical protein
LLWDKLLQYIQSQAQKLNIPVELIPDPASANRFNNSQCIRIIIDESIKELSRIEESTLILGLPLNRDNLNPNIHIVRDSLPQLARAYHQRQKDQLKKLVLSSMESRRTGLKDSIQQAQYTLESLNREMFEAARKTQLDKRLLALLEKPAVPCKRKIASEYAVFKTLVPGLFQFIELDEGRVRARTHLVKIEFESEVFDIGTLDIELDLSRGNAKISNLTNSPNDYPHPHVNDSGEICLGNISSGLSRLLGEFEIYGALELLHKFVHTYNEPDAYQKIQYWNDPDYCEDDDQYERCRESGSYGKTCLDCGDSECPYYENSVEECAEEPDFPKCVTCGERCRAGNDLLLDCHNENPLGCMTCTFSGCTYFRDAESCRNSNPASCQTCKIDYCQYQGVSHEAA